MKKVSNLLLTVILVTASLPSLAQHILVEYDANLNGKNYRNELIINDSQSYWRYVQNDQATIEDNLLSDFIIKDENQNATFSNNSVFGNKFYLKDTLSNMRWTLTNDKKIILEKECYSATTNFRGREYVAYYSPTLLYSNGPWKFGGLPGLILEIKSVDNQFLFTASKIDYQNSENLDYQKPLKNNFLNWDEYKLSFNAAFLKFTKSLRASGTVADGDEVTIKLDMMEFIDNKSQSGNGYKF